jgi:GNAT superfamily N-acetyltransferase
MSQLVWEKAERIRKNPDYTFSMLDLGQIEAFTEYFRTIYNAAWSKHSGVGTMTTLQAKATMKALKPVLEPSLLWFSFYKNEPVAFFIMIPDLNQYFKHLNGKFDLWAKLTFLYHKWRKNCNKMIGVAFGVVPEHQGKGVESAMIGACADVVQKTLPYKEFEMIWIGSFNPKMIKLADNVQTKLTKTHATFRLLFDPNATWTDCPNL